MKDTIQVYKEIDGLFCTIYVDGVLDYATMDSFIEEIKSIERGTEKVIINFEALEFIDSTGIGAIINLVHEAKDKRFSIELEAVRQEINDVLGTIGVFEILETLQKEES
ncbi:anti-sigma B factor antagonist/stage II sporulation protein AA (anti-sigma F factor antagonist) [Oceanobacillus limi]|uniref:Anti-sigma B factor antagonist/stage II sporulation protein AA (Anti-sigma F factor antagonist) n=1 Tax=Oceanobacillus limi TaxID=930131 RepID=A0A1I0BMI4_9BACI|nr:STAS domain-containing protein [Oceanobacillus limi]SET08168.1 anti-sigma B factor antagonist/stage II sporulation protein AA (anti-sigma F factor antagonist) [Oceanobacillus limi]